MGDKKLLMVAEVTPQQIKEWKEKHGQIKKLTSKDEKASFIIKPITRQVLGYASKSGITDPMEYNAFLLRNIMLAGDEWAIEDDAYFMGISAQLGELIQVKEFELEEL